MRNCAILLLLTMCWSACSVKDDGLPPNIQEPPYFSVSYQADMLAEQTVIAGEEGAYLFTDYSTGSNDVVTCTGTFAKVQCQTDTCAGRLRFEFRNAQIGSVVFADTLFQLGDHALFFNDTLQLATVVLRWTDQSGQVWRSDLGPQEPGFSNFQVLATQPYELNEQGQKTWQILVNFVCRLYRDGVSIPFSGQGRIAVGYP